MTKRKKRELGSFSLQCADDQMDDRVTIRVLDEQSRIARESGVDPEHTRLVLEPPKRLPMLRLVIVSGKVFS
jgi:hypothetical protein